MNVEDYDEYGYIKPVTKPTTYNEHRIHETKDYFDGECYLCQKAMKNKVQSYWKDEEEITPA